MNELGLRRLDAAVLATIVIGLLAAVPSRVRAQGWLGDRDRAEGIGIRVGDLELHPGFGAEVGYDSNVFLQDTDTQSAPIMRLTGHLNLATLGPERRGDDGTAEGAERRDPPSVAFRGGLSASLYHYFATDTPTNVEGDLDLRLIINPERPFSVTLFENFGRTVRPFTSPGADNYARDENTAGVNLDFGTRGQIFKGRAGYAFNIDHFEGEDFRFGRSNAHHIDLGTSWRFLPQTAALYDLDIYATGYTNSASSAISRSDSIHVRSRVGFNGAITNRLSLMGVAGYAAGFYDSGDEFDSVVGQLELRWQVNPGTRLAIGYDRDFFRSIMGNFHRRDRGYANFQMLVAGSFMLALDASAGLYDFGSIVGPGGAGVGAGGDSQRSDVRVDASLFAEYRAADWLGINATVGYIGDFTDFEFAPITGAPTDPAKYSKLEAWGGVRLFY